MLRRSGLTLSRRNHRIDALRARVTPFFVTSFFGVSLLTGCTGAAGERLTSDEGSADSDDSLAGNLTLGDVTESGDTGTSSVAQESESLSGGSIANPDAPVAGGSEGSPAFEDPNQVQDEAPQDTSGESATGDSSGDTDDSADETVTAATEAGSAGTTDNTFTCDAEQAVLQVVPVLGLGLYLYPRLRDPVYAALLTSYFCF